MTDINQEVSEAIRKHLPSQIGEALRGELEALAQARLRIHSLEGEIATIREANRGHISKCQGLEAELRQHAALAKREADVAARESQVELNNQAAAFAEKRRQDVFDLVSLIFRAPAVKQQVIGNIPVAVEGHPGNPQFGQSPAGGYVASGALSTTTTTTQE